MEVKTIKKDKSHSEHSERHEIYLYCYFKMVLGSTIVKVLP